MLRDIIFVAGGSALGGVLRLLTGRLVKAYVQTALPWPTFLINILGCFAIGWIHAWATRQPQFRPEILLLLTTGICGGFTTFSAFAQENILLMRSGSFSTAMVYMIASVSVGLFATWVGMLAGR
jgi:fluoride exporter